MSLKDKKIAKQHWLETQERLSDETGLAISLVESDGLDSLVETNDNSICAVLKVSESFSSKCEQYCGSVFSRTEKAGRALKYQCHAGLECVAIPIVTANKKRATVIAGRAFTKAGDYRVATEKAISGEWSGFAPSAVFENVLLTGSQSVEMLAKKIASLSVDEVSLIDSFLSEIKTKQSDETKSRQPEKQITGTGENPPVVPNETHSGKTPGESGTVPKPRIRLPKIQEITRQRPVRQTPSVEKENSVSIKAGDRKAPAVQRGVRKSEAVLPGDRNEWSALSGSILDHNYSEACKRILGYLRDRYSIDSLAWLENVNNHLTTTFAVGNLKKQKIQISVAMNDPRMRKLLLDETSIELRERSISKESNGGSIRLFPIKVGTAVRSALIIGEKTNDAQIIKSVSVFCESLASDLEILRLRDELTRRSWIDIALKKFNDSLTMIDTDDFWIRLMQTTAELVQAERGSLLIYDEKAKKLNVKAAIGRKADVLRTNIDGVGERIAMGVWERGETLLVRNLSKQGIEPAPEEWSYRTNSFISYPLVVGGRKIGVLNIADKTDGTYYEEEDVKLLDSVVPQIAVAADRANLKNKAGEYEQLSVTDPLTGLLNRRYLEERLAEEIKRSERHGYPMSFMMIDVDDFKSYNDQFLHPEGDKALRIVGHRLRDTLRGADVAARYGGEEFSILLPQTTLDEAETIAERIRANIESEEFPHRQVTVSIGIATISPEINSTEKLIECADKALFKAKREGKNQVIVFQSEGAERQAVIH